MKGGVTRSTGGKKGFYANVCLTSLESRDRVGGQVLRARAGHTHLPFGCKWRIQGIRLCTELGMIGEGKCWNDLWQNSLKCESHPGSYSVMS